jgi:hypothetical protein
MWATVGAGGEPLIQGFITREDAEQKLRGKPPGTFLLRVSSQMTPALVVSCMNPTPVHTLIEVSRPYLFCTCAVVRALISSYGFLVVGGSGRSRVSSSVWCGGRGPGISFAWHDAAERRGERRLCLFVCTGVDEACRSLPFLPLIRLRGSQYLRTLYPDNPKDLVLFNHDAVVG